jgi:hypothetical protein
MNLQFIPQYLKPQGFSWTAGTNAFVSFGPFDPGRYFISDMLIYVAANGGATSALQLKLFASNARVFSLGTTSNITRSFVFAAGNTELSLYAGVFPTRGFMTYKVPMNFHVDAPQTYVGATIRDVTGLDISGFFMPLLVDLRKE